MATRLLNDDGTASMATLLMTSHHAFRRDIACFSRALSGSGDDASLAATWKLFRDSLHGHHTQEDTVIFPDLRSKHPEIAAPLDKLTSQHHQIDPLLERCDQLFGGLGTQRTAVRAVVDALAALLDEHLALEEDTIVPYLRVIKEFPAPPSDDLLALYADGFAWSLAGIAESVAAQVQAILPAALVAKLPAARTAFAQRCREVWGYAHEGASETSVPATVSA